jgi:hypothetical protein
MTCPIEQFSFSQAIDHKQLAHIGRTVADDGAVWNFQTEELKALPGHSEDNLDSGLLNRVESRRKS